MTARSFAESRTGNGARPPEPLTPGGRTGVGVAAPSNMVVVGTVEAGGQKYYVYRPPRISEQLRGALASWHAASDRPVAAAARAAAAPPVPDGGDRWGAALHRAGAWWTRCGDRAAAAFLLSLAAGSTLFVAVRDWRRRRRLQAARAAEQAAAFPEGMAGSMTTFSLSTLMQMLSSERVTGTLKVADRSGRPRGAIVFLDGQPVAASCSSAIGERAVRVMLGHSQGIFRFEPGPAPACARTIHTDVTSLLLETHRQLDEERAARPAAACRFENRSLPLNGLRQ